jgi:ketosteroid isomerase-like protein
MKTMIRHLGLLLLAGTIGTSAASCAREEAPAPAAEPAAAVATTGEHVQGVISDLEREWVAAIVNKDGAALGRLLADDFAGTSPSAHLYTKKMAIDDLAAATYVVESMEMDEISVNVYGDTAVAFTSQDEKSRYGTRDTSGHYHYTNVWVNKNGQWQAVASHGTRYETGHQ